MSNAPARTVRQLADHWQVSERHVYNLIAQGKLGHIRIGTLIRVRKEDVEAYEAASWQAPVHSPQPSPVVVPMSAGAGTARASAFELGQKMGAKLRAMAKPTDAGRE